MRLRLAISTIKKMLDFPYCDYDTFQGRKTTRSVTLPLRGIADSSNLWCSADSTSESQRLSSNLVSYTNSCGRPYQPSVPPPAGALLREPSSWVEVVTLQVIGHRVL